MKILETFPILHDFRNGDGGDEHLISALHSGNIGDILYSLPTGQLLGVSHFIVNVCSDPGFGGRVMTTGGARSLAPLLLAQPGVRRVTIVKTGVPWEHVKAADIGVHYNLDSFRLNRSNPFLHLVYQHALPFGLSVDPRRKWLQTGAKAPAEGRSPYLVLALTDRYRRFSRTYFEGLLRDIPADQIYCVGLENEQVQRMNIPGHTVMAEDFLELAKLIEGCTVFLGNPSSPYALAELLKVPRWLDLPDENNVYPLDATGRPLHRDDFDFIRCSIQESLGCTGALNEGFRRLNEAHAAATKELAELRPIVQSAKRTTAHAYRLIRERVQTKLRNLWRGLRLFGKREPV